MSSIELVDDRWPPPPPRDEVRALLDVRSVRYPVTYILEKKQEFLRLLKCYYVAVIDSEDDEIIEHEQDCRISASITTRRG